MGVQVSVLCNGRRRTVSVPEWLRKQSNLRHLEIWHYPDAITYRRGAEAFALAASAIAPGGELVLHEVTDLEELARAYASRQITFLDVCETLYGTFSNGKVRASAHSLRWYRDRASLNGLSMEVVYRDRWSMTLLFRKR